MREKRTNTRKIILIFVAVLIFGAAETTAGYFVYKKGVEAGEEAVRDEVQENLTELGVAIAEKNTLVEKIEELKLELPAEFNAENIETYKEKIDELRENIDLEEAKIELAEFAEKVEEFRAVYAGENNDEIAVKLAELKEAAEATGRKLTAIYNRKIRARANELKVFSGFTGNRY